MVIEVSIVEVVENEAVLELERSVITNDRGVTAVSTSSNKLPW